MHDLPSTWGALCAVVLLLGLRHGLDADHLAAIDGLTRAGRPAAPARWSGALFSLGHGAVVIVVAMAAAALGARWAPPRWFDVGGALVSIGFLAALGLLNLRAAWRGQAPAGPRAQALLRWLGGGPAAALAMGALFALGFDTLSLAALFAVTGTQHGGAAHALALGTLFTLGMLACDAANGWWVAQLIRRSDRRAAVASRVMTAAVALASLGVAALGAARLGSATLDGWLAGRELAAGLGVLVIVAGGYAVARRAARVSAAAARG